MRIGHGRLLAILVALILAGSSSAASGVTTTPAPTPPPPTTPPAPKPSVPPVKGQLKLALEDLFAVHKQLVTVHGRHLMIVGTVRPYVAGQWVTLRAAVGRRTVKRARVLVKPAQHGSLGHFFVPLSSPSSGHVVVTATHARSTAQLGFEARRGFLSLSPSAGPGATGRFVQLVQQRLAALHFYLRQSGVYDDGTGLAVDAYHRLLGWGTSHSLDGKTVSYLLNGWGKFKVRFPHHGKHAEGNLSKQLLALVDGAKVVAIFPISSGKPSTPTILGDFHIYRRDPGYLPDGMYYSSFFIGGYAIHGYNPAPDYPASHGCMRVPISDAVWIYNWLNFGDWVDSYS